MKYEFTSIDNAQGTLVKTAIREFKYDKNGNVTEVKDYDWFNYSSIPRDGQNKPTGLPAGVQPVHVTVNKYFSPTPDSSDTTTNDPDTYSKPTSPRLRNALKSSEARTSSGAVVARAESFYDNEFTTGNLTQLKSWDSSKGAVSDPLNASNSISVTNQYDVYGNVTLSTDPKGNQTDFTYNQVGGFIDLYPTRVVKAFGTSVALTTDFEYDFHTGLQTRVIDVNNGVATATTYDVFGRPTLVRAAEGKPEETRSVMEYSDTARRVIVRSDLNDMGDGKLVAIQHYDQLGRLRLSRQLEDAATQSATDETAGIKVQMRYRFSGSNSYLLTSNPYRAATSGGASGEATMGWGLSKKDNGGRLIEVRTYAGASLPSPWGSNSNSTGAVTTAYGSNDVTVTDQANKVRRTLVDGLGRLIEVHEPDGTGDLGSVSNPKQKTSYLYDVLNNLAKVTQGSQTRYFMYDSLSRLIRARNPEQDVYAPLSLSDPVTGNTQWNQKYFYDNNGNLTSKTDARGVRTDYDYDPLNRLTLRNYFDATPDVSYEYDAAGVTNSKGRLTKVSSSVSVYEYQGYDALGRVLSGRQITDTYIYPMSYTYDRAGNMKTESYPSGRVVTMSFDPAGRLSSVVGVKDSVTTQYASQMSYTAHGAMSQMTLGNNTRETMAYNPRLQVTQIELRKTSDTSLLLGLDYGYASTTNNGNILSQTIRIGDQGTTTTINQSYAYDSLNRLEGETEAGGWSQSYGYDRYGNRAVTGGNVPNPTLTPMNLNEFNATTNRISACLYDTAGNILQDQAQDIYQYDAENRLKDYNNGAAKYYYDGDGRRVKKEVGVETTIFVYNAGGQLVAEYTTGNPQGSGTRYLTMDHLGSTRLVTDSIGDVKSRRDYLPFGEEIGSGIGSRTEVMGYSQTDGITQQFTGKERDDESGLDYFWARYYSGAQGRFTSADSFGGSMLNPQTLNLYLYVQNNPLVFIDPTGHAALPSKTSRGAEYLLEKVKRLLENVKIPNWFYSQDPKDSSGLILPPQSLTERIATSIFGWFVSNKPNAKTARFYANEWAKEHPNSGFDPSKYSDKQILEAFKKLEFRQKSLRKIGDWRRTWGHVLLYI